MTRMTSTARATCRASAENDGFGFTYTELEMWVDGMTDDFFEED